MGSWAAGWSSRPSSFLVPDLAIINAPGNDLAEPNGVFAVLIDLLLFAERVEDTALERGLGSPVPVSSSVLVVPSSKRDGVEEVPPSSAYSSMLCRDAILVITMESKNEGGGALFPAAPSLPLVSGASDALVPAFAAAFCPFLAATAAPRPRAAPATRDPKKSSVATSLVASGVSPAFAAPSCSFSAVEPRTSLLLVVAAKNEEAGIDLVASEGWEDLAVLLDPLVISCLLRSLID